MHQIKLNNQYLIHKTIFETQGLTIFKGLSLTDDTEIFYNIHCIRYKKLLKYYLSIADHLKEELPLEDTFVINGELYLVFKSSESGVPLFHHSLSTHEKKHLLLSLLAKFALNTKLPNFIRWQLLHPEYLWVDSNRVLHMDIHLELLNPELFSDFDSIQNRIAELIPAIFEAPDEDLALKKFSENCQAAVYPNDLAMLADYKYLMGLSIERTEPWLYEQLYQLYLRIKHNKKQLVMISIIFLIGYYGLKQFGVSDAMMRQPYQKTIIGTAQYDDPYSETIGQTESITIDAPKAPPKTATESKTPTVTPTPSTKPANPEYQTYMVNRGEYLVKLSIKFYGDGKYAWALAKYNGLKNPSMLKVAFPLKIPQKQIIEKLYAEMQGKK